MTFEEYMESKFGSIDSVPEEIVNLLRKIYVDMEKAKKNGLIDVKVQLSRKLESYVSQIKPQLDNDIISNSNGIRK